MIDLTNLKTVSHHFHGMVLGITVMGGNKKGRHHGVAPAGLSSGTAAVIATAAGAPVAAWTASTSGTSTAALPGVAFLGFFDRPAFEHGLAGEADLAHRVDAGHHDGNLVADLADIFDFFDPFAVELGDVHHAIRAGQDLHEGAEIGDADNLAGVDATQLRGFGDGFDALACHLRAFAIGGGNVDGAIFFDVDLGAGLFLQGADILAAGADDGADLIRRDLDGGNARGMRFQFRARAPG